MSYLTKFSITVSGRIINFKSQQWLSGRFKSHICCQISSYSTMERGHGICILFSSTPSRLCALYFQLFAAIWLLHVIASSAQDSICQNMMASPVLTPFVDALPIPPSIVVNNLTTLTISSYKITQKLHRDLNPTTLYAYGVNSSSAMFPGPTLEATRGNMAKIYWANNIPDATHFLPVDRTIHWANPTHGGVPNVVHLHGAETQSTYDGHPDAWFTPPTFGDHGPTYTTQNYSYPNQQRTAMLWYHDHTVGITRLNVLAGLTGLYMLRSTQEQNLTRIFTPGVFEIPFVIKDLQFWSNGSINFPNIGDSPDVHPQWCPEYFGDTILVNGKVWPYLNVSSRIYRFRMLNGANARFFNLTFSNPSLRFVKIGTDGGFLPGGPQIVSSLLISPAERIDCLVDFSNLTVGTVVYVNNSAVAPFPSGNPTLNPPQTSWVSQFRVVAANSATSPTYQDVLTSLQQATATDGNPFANYSNALHRELTLVEYDDAIGNPIESTLGNRSWTDLVTENPAVGAVEVWEMINLTPDAHPIHVHLIQFQVLNQQPLNLSLVTPGTSILLCNITIPYGQPGTCFTGPPMQPAIYQTGLKDTAIVWPGNVTRYGMHFVASSGGSFAFDPTVGPGYVWHCHILDHEDNDMMRPYTLHH